MLLLSLASPENTHFLSLKLALNRPSVITVASCFRCSIEDEPMKISSVRLFLMKKSASGERGFGASLFFSHFSWNLSTSGFKEGTCSRVINEFKTGLQHFFFKYGLWTLHDLLLALATVMVPTVWTSFG